MAETDNSIATIRRFFMSDPICSFDLVAISISVTIAIPITVAKFVSATAIDKHDHILQPCGLMRFLYFRQHPPVEYALPDHIDGQIDHPAHDHGIGHLPH